jgi:CRP-like cAMP-binding protein
VAAALAAVIRDVDVVPGQVVYRDGEAATDVYFVVSGRLELSRKGEERWYLVGQSMLGIIDCSLQRAYSRTVSVDEPTHLLKLGFDDFMEVLQRHSDAALRLVVWGATQNRELAAKVAAPSVFFGGESPSDATITHEAFDWGDSVARTLALGLVPALSRAPVQALASLGRAARPHRFAAGAQVLRQFEWTKQLYVLVEGSVRLRAPGLDARVSPARVLGDLAMLGTGPCPYEFVAETDVVVLMLSRDTVYDIVEDHFGLVRSLFARISEQRERLLERAHGARSLE